MGYVMKGPVSFFILQEKCAQKCVPQLKNNVN